MTMKTLHDQRVNLIERSLPQTRCKASFLDQSINGFVTVLLYVRRATEFQS